MAFLNHNIALGLDISDASLKACLLTRRHSGIFLNSAESVRVNPGWIEKGLIVKQEEVAKLIKQLIRKVQRGRNKIKLINTVLPDTSTFIKLIEVPESDNDEQLASSIKQEASHHIPYSVDDVYMDWQPIESETLKRNSQEVLIGGCPKEVVDQYASVIHKAGYILHALEIESLPITRSVFEIERGGKSLSNRNVIVVDFGAHRSSLIFWREQKFFNVDTIEFSVSLPVSGRVIDSIIQDKLNLTPQQAEKFKIKCGLLDKGECKGILKKLLSSELKDFVMRIKQSIDFHNSHFSGITINKIVLCGGGARLKGFDVFIKNELGLRVEVSNPMINLKESNILTREDSLSYTTAIGLALKNFYA